MAGWYDRKNNKLDIDISKVSSDGALTAKAAGDAFLGVAGVIEDRKKLDILEADAKARNEKNQYDLSKAYAEDTQNAIDKTYLGYVDTNTGKFNQEQLDKDNVGLPMNQVSMDARLKQKQLENAYSVDLEKIDKKAQEEISNEVVKEIFKYGSKDEFTKNVNPDLIRYANGTTMVAVDKFYNDATVQEAKLNNAAAKLENASTISGLKMDMKKQELDLKEKEFELKKNKPKEMNSGDEALIARNIGGYFGKTDGFGNFEIEDDVSKDAAIKVTARASELKMNNPSLTLNQVSNIALQEYQESLKPKTQEPTPPVEQKKQETNIKSIFERFNLPYSE